MSETAACECGHTPEDPYHYFLRCDRYQRQRRDIVKRIPLEAWTLTTIMPASTRYNDALNKEISLTVQTYITSSARF